MSYLFAHAATFILGVTITAIVSRAFRDTTIYFVPHASANILNSAQHAANMSRQDQVVIFDGSRFRIVKAQNQYSVEGHVVYVAHPEAI